VLKSEKFKYWEGLKGKEEKNKQRYKSEKDRKRRGRRNRAREVIRGRDRMFKRERECVTTFLYEKELVGKAFVQYVVL
jgi:hypothetical protein